MITTTQQGFPSKPRVARFPNRIRSLRLAEQLTLTELGRIAGISRRHIDDIEAGAKMPSAAALHDIAAALGVGVADIFDHAWSERRQCCVREARRSEFARLDHDGTRAQPHEAKDLNVEEPIWTATADAGKSHPSDPQGGWPTVAAEATARTLA